MQTIHRVDPTARVHVNSFTPDSPMFTEMLGVEASPGIFFVPTLGSRGKRLRWLIGTLPAAVLLALASLLGRRALLVVAPAAGRRRATELRRMAESDLILAAGGGYLNDDYRAMVPFLILELVVASGTAKPVVLGAQTIGPFRSRLTRALFRVLAARVREIQVRDRYSLEQVARAAPEAVQKCRLVPDYAFSDTEHARSDTRPRRRLAISLRFWSFGSSPDPRAARERYWTELRNLVEWWACENGGDVTLVPTNYRTRGSRDDDLEACDRLLQLLTPRALSRTRVERRTLAADELRSLIASCSAFVGTRMHACIFALVVGTPVVVIPYQEKSTALMELLGLSNDVVPMDTQGDRTLVQAVQATVDRSNHGRRQLPLAALLEFRRVHEMAISRWMVPGPAQSQTTSRHSSALL